MNDRVYRRFDLLPDELLPVSFNLGAELCATEVADDSSNDCAGHCASNCPERSDMSAHRCPRCRACHGSSNAAVRLVGDVQVVWHSR